MLELGEYCFVSNRIPAEQAFRVSIANKGAKWPGKGDPRIVSFWLPSISRSFGLEPGESIFTIGSCFARHIEIALRDKGFVVPALDFKVPQEELFIGTKMASGILNKYTPHSMLNEIEFAFSESDGSEFLFHVGNGNHFDPQLHTNAPTSLERCMQRRQDLRELYRRAVQNSRILVITLGLVETWWDQEKSLYLNDTPHQTILKQYPSRLLFEVLSVQNTIDVVRRLIMTLKNYGRADQKVLLTVSPVPFSRTFSAMDAVSANCYSKSALRVAAQVVTEECNWVDYYPSFESIAHSDKQSTWEDDQIHVKMQAVKANVDRMIETYCSA